MSFYTPAGPSIPPRQGQPAPSMPAHSAKRASVASQFSATSASGRSDTSPADYAPKSEDGASAAGADQPDGPEGSGSAKRKRPKFSRATRACIPCRLRKCKCAGAPPAPCTNCVEDEYPCQWPTEDGRSSKARKRQSRSKKVLAAMGAEVEDEAEGAGQGQGPETRAWQDLQHQEQQRRGPPHTHTQPQHAQPMNGFAGQSMAMPMTAPSLPVPGVGMGELNMGLEAGLDPGLGIDWLEELGVGLGVDGAVSFNTPTPGLSLQLQTQTFPSALPQFPLPATMDFSAHPQSQSSLPPPQHRSTHTHPQSLPTSTSMGSSNPFSPSMFTTQTPGPHPIDASAQLQRTPLSWPSSAMREQTPQTLSHQQTSMQPNYLQPFTPDGPISGPSYAVQSNTHSQPHAQIISTTESDPDPTMTAWDAAFPDLDPASFIYLMSSRLPTVEESSVKEDVSPLTGSGALWDFSPGFGGTDDAGRNAADRGRSGGSTSKGLSAGVGDRDSMLQSGQTENSRTTLQPPARSASQAGRVGPKEEEKGKIVKMTWWRPHGQTAIAPGLKRITLKVRVSSPTSSFHTPSPFPDPFASGPPTSTHLSTSASASSDPSHLPSSSTEDLFDPSGSGAPSAPLMAHLLPLFLEHFGCQFPFLASSALASDLSSGEGSVFLWCCIAATAARFSSHPALARPEFAPHEYGTAFHLRARDLLGSMLSVPNRRTVMALVLLAHLGFGADSESEEWMCTGMAVRMSVDLGLHLDPGDEIPSEECRLNRLLFWSVFALDIAIASGVGRQTTIRLDEITQPLPTEEDIRESGSPLKQGQPDLRDPADPDVKPVQQPVSAAARTGPRSPFPYTVRQMTLYAPIINLLNAPKKTMDPKWAEDIQGHLNGAIREYNQLPGDMQWNVVNLQEHGRANQAPIFVHLHLWMHLMIASGYLTDTAYLRRHGPSSSANVPLSRPPATSGLNAPHMSGHITPNIAPMRGAPSGTATPNALAATNLWRNSVRTIGDILLLSDIVKPMAYLALPFVNQALFAAACCHIKEMEQQEQSRADSANLAASGTGSRSLVSSPRRRPRPMRSHTEPKRTPLRSETRTESSTDDEANGGRSGSGGTATDASDPSSPSHSPNPLATSPTAPPHLSEAPPRAPAPSALKQVDLFHELFKSVALNNIAAFQAGLARQTTYWSGVAWVAEALQQRLAGVGASAIDLAEVTEKLRSCVSVPDAGVLRGLAARVGREMGVIGPPQYDA